jgi:hypothetical protein
MINSPMRLLWQIYLLLVLLGAATLSSLPYSPVALILSLMVLFIIFSPLHSWLNIVITIAAILIIPLILEPLTRYLIYMAPFFTWMGKFIVVIAILPIIHLLDYNLRQYAQNMTIVHYVRSRHTTTIFNALLISAISTMLISIVINNSALLFTTIVLVLYLLGILIQVFLAIPRLPIHISAIRKRVIAGTAADISLYAVNKASIRLHTFISSVDSWIRITPHLFTINGDETELNLIVTPSLAGPSHPQFQASVIDPRGILQVNQQLQPVELHVIPRARYAEWLAVRFLEQIGRGSTEASTVTPDNVVIPKRGLEYSDNNIYQPGDLLRDIDWKHSLKLNELIIKRYIEAGAQPAIIAVNLSVANAEEADKLAFNMITVALILAQNTIPTALAVYDQKKVILTSFIIDPREVLRRTLTLVKHIKTVRIINQFLQLPDVGMLRRDIGQLKQATSKPSQQLYDLLEFEYQALNRAAKDHPATQALTLATKYVPAPATIIIVSQLNHDAEALLVNTDKLSRREYEVITLEMKR